MRTTRIATRASGAVLLLASLALLEVLSAILFANLPSRFNNGKRVVAGYIGSEPDTSGTIEPHPYLLYQNTKDAQVSGFRQHNSRRYRGKDFASDKSPETTRFLALGGSTTYMFPFVPDPDDTWVARLEAMLRRDYGETVEVINAGKNYATSAEMLAAYVFRHQYLEPDVLIIHTGGNDIFPLLFEDYDPEYTHFRGHGTGLIPRDFEASLLSWSRVFRLFYAMWLNSDQTVYSQQPHSLALLDRAEALERVKSNESPGFRRNLDTLIRMATSDGVAVILFGHLQAREEILSRNRRDLEGLEQALIVGLEKHYRIMGELSVKYDIPLIVPDQQLFDDSWFLDFCHLNEQGEAVKAGILFEHFATRAAQYFGPASR